MGLGIVGIFLPALPTVPFLLLASFCFSKGSKRFHDWFIQTKLYKNHLENFEKNKSMTLKNKNWTALLIQYNDSFSDFSAKKPLYKIYTYSDCDI